MLFKFQRYRWFWILKGFKDFISFNINRIFYVKNTKIRSAKEEISIMTEMVKLTLFSFFSVLALVSFLEIIEYIIINFVIISKPPLLVSVIEIFNSLHKELAENSGYFVTLISITASVSGLFLGLYFTALSVVTSSAFTKVPGDLRSLLLKEKVGNIYIRILAYLASASLLLLGYILFGGNVGVLNSALIVIIMCFGIFSFVVLGRRVFIFLDLTILGDTIFNDLIKTTMLPTIKGFRWYDPNFQYNYNKVARNNISILKALIELSIKKESFQEKSLSKIIVQCVYFLNYYEKQRYFIPSESRWYSQIPKYKDWFLTDYTELEIAIKTKTSLRPTMIKNDYWVQDEIVDSLMFTSKANIENGNIEVLYETIDSFTDYFKTLGFDLEIQKGSDILEKIEDSIDYYYKLNPFEDKNYKNIEMALYDVFNLNIISLSLGLYDLIRDFKDKKINLDEIVKINWNRNRDIYNHRIAPIVLAEIESIKDKLQFEIKVENKIITPNWYIKQQLAKKYLELFFETIKIFLKLIEKLFLHKSEEFMKNKSYILSTNNSQRGLEMCWKLKANIPDLEKVVNDLEKMKISTDFELPKWEWKEIIKSLNDLEDNIIKNLALCLPSLSYIEHREDKPDFFGQVYNTLCVECYNSLTGNNIPKFNSIFPSFFIGSFHAYEKLGKELKKITPLSSMPIIIEPLMDLFEISGYSIIYSELFGIPEFRSIMEQTWKNYFDHKNKIEDIIKMLIEVYNYKESLIMLMPRDILRTEWRLYFNSKLRDLKLIDSPFYTSDYLDRRKINHKSSLIRALCRGGYEPHVKAGYVFIVIFLLKLPEAKGITFNDVYKFAERIEQENNSVKEKPIC